MKRLFQSIALALALCGSVAVLPVTVTGCKTSAQTTVYKSLLTVATAVNSAYAAFLDQVIAGKIAPEKVAPVSADYQLFQSSLQAAIAGAQGNSAAIASPEVLAAGAKVLNDITLAKGAK